MSAADDQAAREARHELIINLLLNVVGAGLGLYTLYALVRFVKWAWG